MAVFSAPIVFLSPFTLYDWRIICDFDSYIVHMHFMRIGAYDNPFFAHEDINYCDSAALIRQVRA
jgi:hypothetical protein